MRLLEIVVRLFGLEQLHEIVLGVELLRVENRDELFGRLPFHARLGEKQSARRTTRGRRAVCAFRHRLAS